MEKKKTQKNVHFGIYMKLMNHYFQSLTIVLTFKIPYAFSSSVEAVGADPRKAFFSLECLMSTKF